MKGPKRICPGVYVWDVFEIINNLTELGWIIGPVYDTAVIPAKVPNVSNDTF